MKKTYLSKIMLLAWQFRRQTGVDFGECLKKAWANYKVVRRMRNGIAPFLFHEG